MTDRTAASAITVKRNADLSGSPRRDFDVVRELGARRTDREFASGDETADLVPIEHADRTR